MQASEFKRHLDQGSLAPAYLFTGESGFLMDEVWNQLLEKAVPAAARRFNGERLFAKEVPASDVIERLSNIPMFGTKRLLMVRNVEVWPKDQRTMIVSYLSKPNPISCLVMTASQKKGIEKIESAVNAIGAVVHFQPLTEREAPRWLQERARYHQKRLSPQAASFLVEQVGPDLNRLERELEKLSAYVGSREKIELEDVKETVGSQRSFTVFELLRYVAARQSKKAIVSLRTLMLSGEPPLAVLALLARQIRLVWQVKDALERKIPTGQISQKLNLYQSALQGYVQQASVFSYADLDKIHQAISEADIILKSTASAPELILEELILRLCLNDE